MSGFDEKSTTDEVLEGIDLRGKRIVITGTSSGLGLESTRALASRGAAVTMLARNVEKNEAAAESVRATVPGAVLEVRELNLTSLASVRACAEGILAAQDHIAVLLNNAGVMCCPYSQTADGFESQLGTNHLGHFLLSILLAPLLGGDSPSRLIELSSGAHAMSDVDFDDPMFERREYDPWIAYAQSKTANALFALEFDKRMRKRGVSAFSVHPGMIMTELARHFTPVLMEGLQRHVEKAAREAGEEGPVDASAGMTFKPLEVGAATQCWAATAPELGAHGGEYLADCRVGVRGENPRDHGVAPHAQDPESAARLWALSEALVGQKLDA